MSSQLEILVRNALDLEKQAQWTEALHAWNILADTLPPWHESLLGLYRCYRAMDQHHKAADMLALANQKFGYEPAVNQALITHAFDEGRYQDCLNLCATATGPQSPGLLLTKAAALFRTGSIDDAIASYDMLAGTLDHAVMACQYFIQECNRALRPDLALSFIETCINRYPTAIDLMHLHQVMCFANACPKERWPDPVDILSAHQRHEGEKNLQILWSIRQSRRPPGTSFALPRKPRIALCLSGQMRGYTQCLPNLKHQLLSRFEVDIYIATWDKPGQLSATDIDSRERAERCLPAAFAKALPTEWLIPGLIARYFPSTCILDETPDITPDNLKNAYPGASINIFPDIFLDQSLSTLDAPLANISRNQLRMLLMMREVNRLRKESGRDYDLVIRMRPDKQLTLAPDWLEQIRPHTDTSVYVDAFTAGGVGDQISVSRPDAMDIYCDAFDSLSVWCRQPAGVIRWNPIDHCYLYDHLFANGLDMLPLPLTGLGALENPVSTKKSLCNALKTDLHAMKGKINSSLHARLSAALEQDSKN